MLTRLNKLTDSVGLQCQQQEEIPAWGWFAYIRCCFGYAPSHLLQLSPKLEAKQRAPLSRRGSRKGSNGSSDGRGGPSPTAHQGGVFLRFVAAELASQGVVEAAVVV